MLPDDVFRARLRDVQARVRVWMEANRDAAEIEETETDTYWRIGAEPYADNTCPLELIVHQSQTFDLSAGPETYEGCTLEEVNLPLLLVDAIADGRIVTRHWTSSNTGAVRAVETIIVLADGGAWRRQRLNEPIGRAIAAEDCEARDRLYAPYKRR